MQPIFCDSLSQWNAFLHHLRTIFLKKEDTGKDKGYQIIGIIRTSQGSKNNCIFPKLFTNTAVLFFSTYLTILY